MYYKLVGFRDKRNVSLNKLWESNTEMQELTLKTPQGSIPMCFSREHHSIVPWLIDLQSKGIIDKDTKLVNIDTHSDASDLFYDLNQGNWVWHIRKQQIFSGIAFWVKGFRCSPTHIGTSDYELTLGYGAKENIIYNIEDIKNKVKGKVVVTLDLDYLASNLEIVSKEEIQKRIDDLIRSIFSEGITLVAFHVCVSEEYLSKPIYIFSENTPNMLLKMLESSLQREGMVIQE